MLPWVARRALAPQQAQEGQEGQLLRVQRLEPEVQLGLVVLQQEQRHAVLLVWIVQQVRCCLRAAIRAACH